MLPRALLAARSLFRCMPQLAYLPETTTPDTTENPCLDPPAPTRISPRTPDTMYATASRRALGSLIPPKIASPAAVVRPPSLPLPDPRRSPHPLVTPHASQSSGGTSTRTQSVISFYSKLPKGPEPAAQKSTGLRGKYFEGANASG